MGFLEGLGWEIEGNDDLKGFDVADLEFWSFEGVKTMRDKAEFFSNADGRKGGIDNGLEAIALM